MSKIYAALEHARAEREAVKTAGANALEAYPEPIPRIGLRSAPTMVPVPHKAEIAVENDIVALYDPVLSSFPDGKGVVVFTSPNGAAGTSTVAQKFAVFLAQQTGHATLLIDANRRNPSQLSRFGIEQDEVLDEVIGQGAPLDVALHPARNSNLKVAAFAKQPTRSPAPLAAQHVDQLLTGLRDRFDVIVFDCPPASTTPDTLALSAKADSVALVIDANVTRAWQAKRNMEIIEGRGGRVIGLVFNKRRFYVPRWLYGRV